MIKRQSFITLGFSLLLLAFISIIPAQAQEIKLNIQKNVLDNGLTILTCEDKTAPTVAYITFINAGSREEKPGTTGLAHIFEHMMFRGTEKYPVYHDAVASFGAGTNASTGEDYTNYFVIVKKDYLEDIIPIEADRLRNLIFTNETFRTEMGPVKEERRRFDVDDPDGFISDELVQLAYQVHPYHHPVIGFEEDLEKNIKLQDGLDFKRNFYSPAYTTVIVTGNFDTPKVLELIKKYYGDWEKSPAPEINIPAEPQQVKERVRNYVWKDSQVSPKLLLAFHGPNFEIEDNDFCALHLISRIMFMSSGRITKKLYRDLQLVEHVSGDMEDRKDPGLFVIRASLKRGKSLDEVKSIILEELDKLKSEPVTDEELQKTKNSMKAEMVYRMESPLSVAYTIGHNQLIGGDYNLLFETQKKYKEVTPEMIQEVAERYLTPENRIVITLIPKK
jgi:zinc protease